jgi:hypothetical protein
MTEKTYHPAPGRTFTLASVERALDSHQAAGLLRSWCRHPSTHGSSGTRAIPLYVVCTTDGDEIGLANAWEAHAFVYGLASARAAFERKAAREKDSAQPVRG